MTSANTITPPAAAGRFSLTGVINWFVEMLNRFLNWLFALRHTAASTRSTVVWGLFYLIAIYLIAGSHSVEQWGEVFGNLLKGMLSLPLPEGVTKVSAVTDLLWAVFGNLEAWDHLLALAAPFWLMQRIAAIYLSDIFEKEESVALEFINQAAFAADYNTVRIREGKIVEADQNSPVVQIGGPGYVMVELDSAALFERPDGTVHIIPPTVGEWHSKVVIEGFERIRQAADLRDLQGSQEISSRSRDGIPVVAKDIQYSYSIYRGENAARTLQTPYPFVEKAVESLAYKLPRMVKPGVQPLNKPDWHSPLPGKIVGPIQLELGSFVSKRSLSEFLASIGAPEEDALRSREDELDKMGRQLSGRNGNNAGEILFKPAVFTARSNITALFYDEAGFKKRAAERGFQLNWIGVGTWVTPAEIIPANHLEAWKISRENFLRSDPEELKKLEQDARLQESLRLIQSMPVAKFYELKPASDGELIDKLVGDYYERIQSAIELFERDGQDLPQVLLAALSVLNDVRGINQRWVGDN